LTSWRESDSIHPEAHWGHIHEAVLGISSSLMNDRERQAAKERYSFAIAGKGEK
jgi:hypothetical protein